jgi:hypothetical protein
MAFKKRMGRSEKKKMPPPREIEVDEKLMEQLRALGYVE